MNGTVVLSRTLLMFYTLSLGYFTWSFPCAMAQETEEFTFRASSSLTIMDVLVTDKRTGARVDSLREEHFKVYDEGRQQKIAYFRTPEERDRPLAILLIVDTNNFTRKIVPLLQEGLKRGLSHLHSDDKVAVMTHRETECNLVARLTEDRERILAALQEIVLQQEKDMIESKSKKKNKEPHQTYSDPVLQSVWQGLTHAREDYAQARPVLVYIDKDMNYLPKKAVDPAQRQLIASNAIVSGLRKVDAGTAAIKKIIASSTIAPWSKMRGSVISFFSEKTGGEMIDIHEDEYSEALEHAIGNIAGRYIVGFVPDETRLDGRLHKLKVQVNIPRNLGKARKIEIQTRQAYLASKK